MNRSGEYKTAATIIGTGSTVAEKFATTLYLPALPAMAISFALDRDLAQQSVPVMLIGIALSQFFWGRISDNIGHRRVLFLLVPLYVAGTAFSATAASFSIFLFGLFLQGFAIGAIFSVSQALVGSIIGKQDTARILALIALLASWASAVGAMVGGLLMHHFGWHMPFVFLGFLVLSVGGLYFLIPSGDPKLRATPLSFKAFFEDYGVLLRDSEYLKYVTVVAWLNAGLFVFLAQSPFVLIHDWGLTAHEYGLLMFIPFSGIAFGRFLCARLDGRMNADPMIVAGGAVSVAGGAAMFGFHETGMLNSWTLMGSMSVYLVGLGISAPNARAKAMHAVTGLIGSGASLLSVIVNLLGSLSSSLAGHLPDSALSLLILGAAIINIALFIARHDIRR